MRILLLAILLSACVATNERDDQTKQIDDQTKHIDEIEVETDAAKTSSRPAKKGTKPPGPSAPPIKVLPPCEIDAENKRVAILQALDCVLETADKTKSP